MLKYILDLQCQQKTLLEEVDSYVNHKTIVGSQKTIDPFVKVCLACCAPGCTTDTPVVLLLSEALAAIVSCVCTAKTTAENALTIAQDAFYQSDTVLKTQVLEQQLLINSLVIQNVTMQTSLCKLEKALTNAYIPIPSTC